MMSGFRERQGKFSNNSNVPMCRHSHTYKFCQSLRRGNSVLEVAVFEIVGKKTFTARSRMVWSLPNAGSEWRSMKLFAPARSRCSIRCQTVRICLGLRFPLRYSHARTSQKRESHPWDWLVMTSTVPPNASEKSPNGNYIIHSCITFVRIFSS